MSEPLSVAAGVAGLISLGIQVTEGLVRFYTSYKNQDANVARTTEKLENLLVTFRCLNDALQKRIFRPEEQELIKKIQSSVQQCDELIQELQQECDGFKKDPTNGLGKAIKVAGRRLAYPFRQSTLQKLNEDIDEIRENLSLAFDVLQLRDHKQTQDDIAEINALLQLMRLSQISKDVHDWFNPPDATVNHNGACAKRHPGTGMWFINSDQFNTWLAQGNSLLWIKGFAGSGKSVLCSTAIQHVFRQKRYEPKVGVAFFYFTFNNESKRDASAMLRALIMQLSGQMKEGHNDLRRLQIRYKQGVPPTPVLTEHLQSLIKKFDQVYILLDALDESPRYRQREKVLDLLLEMKDWALPGLHMLVTSRDEVDIRQALTPVCNQETGMKNAEIDKDIGNSISYRLMTDVRLQKWTAHRDRIQEALSSRACGVFRWVECQFEALKRCPGSLRNLEKCLQSLPRSLDETYERMLCSIDENSVPEARRILTLLCYSARPLKVSELIDGIAVDLNEPAGLNLDARLQSIEDIYDICPGLIEITDEKHEKLVNETQNIYEDVRVPTARIAHFSVREYLESSRIREQQAAKFALESTTAHSEVAHICVVYLQTDDLIQEQSELSIHDNFPLAEYAAKSWVGHYRDCQRLLPQLDNHVRQLLERKDTVAAWRRLYIRGWDFIDLKDNDVELDGVASSAYYASFLGLDQLLRKLMNEMKVSGGVHATCGELALYVASHFDHSRVVEMWLDAGTDVNSNNGAPLSIAAFFGHERTVRVLLDAGADVNLSTGRFLILAVCRGHEKIIQMLLDAGADVNSNNGASLLAAVMLSRGMIVKMLLDAGADANFQAVSAAPELLVFLINGFALDLLTDHLTGNEDEEFDTDHRFPYPTGTPENHEKVAKMLLDVGVDVNRANYVPFLEACYTSRVGFLEAFEDMGYSESAIDNNCSDPFGGKVSNLLWRTGNPDNETALSFAAIRGSEKIVQLLLDAGADANSDNGAPLSEAAAQGNTKVVKLLLDAGANRCCLDDRPLEERAGYYVDSDSEW